MSDPAGGRVLVVDAFPALAAELRSALVERGEPNLAGQVDQLTAIDRCRCGDDFCATMYTRPPPAGAWGPGLRSVDLPVRTGLIIVDVLDGSIVSIEVLFRPEIRERLLRLVP